MSKFSNIVEKIDSTNTLSFENETLTSDDLNELFNNKDVKTKVYTLSMINCNISTIPNSITKLEKVRQLLLNYNNISNFPEDFGKLKLNLLQLSGNPVTVNKHNIDSLLQVYNNTPATSTRKNAARPRIYFDNIDRRSYKPIKVIGNLDLVSNRSVNHHILLKSDFEELKKMVPEPAPAPAPKLSSSSLSSLSSSPTAPSPSSLSSSEPKSKSSSSSKASKASKASSSSKASKASKASSSSKASKSSSSKRSTKKKKSTPK